MKVFFSKALINADKYSDELFIFPQSKSVLFQLTFGATSIEKIPKISASGQNFLDPPPPPLQKRALPTKTLVFRTY